MTDKEYQAYVVPLLNKLAEAQAEIERLALDVAILTSELEHERRPKHDER